MSNPFTVALNADPPLLVGRDEEVQTIVEGICDAIPRSYAVIGPKSLGTSAILKHLAHPDGALKQYAGSLKLKRMNLNQVRAIYINFAEWPVDQRVTSWLVERAFNSDALRDVQSKRRKGGSSFPVDELADAIKNAALKHKQRTLLILDKFDDALAQLPPDEASRFRPLLINTSVVIGTQVPMERINRGLSESPFFSYLHDQILLGPLSGHYAQALLRKYWDTKAPYNDNHWLTLTGTHPVLILRGGEVWYDVHKDYGDLHLPAEKLNQIIEDRLRTQLRPHFVNLFQLLTAYYPDQLPTMRFVAERDELGLAEAQVSPKMSSDLDELLRLGVICYESGTRHWQSFSLLWRDFIRLSFTELDQLAKAQSGKRRKRNTTKDQLVLRYLRSRSRRLCSHKEIIQAVWQEPDSKEMKHVLRLVISRLRKRLQESQVYEGEIIGHRGRGYEYRP